MQTENNLIPVRTKEEARQRGRNGGIASGKSRQRKKLIKDILTEILSQNAKDSPHFSKLASKLGIEDTKSIKDVFSMVCLLNSVKDGNLGDLEKLVKLLGEDKSEADSSVLAKLDEVIGKVDELAE